MASLLCSAAGSRRLQRQWPMTHSHCQRANFSRLVFNQPHQAVVLGRKSFQASAQQDLRLSGGV